MEKTKMETKKIIKGIQGLKDGSRETVDKFLIATTAFLVVVVFFLSYHIIFTSFQFYITNYMIFIII